MPEAGLTDEFFMQQALEQARIAEANNEVPIGAIIVQDQTIIVKKHNQCEHQANPLHHAEILSLNEAAQKLNRWRLNDCTLYVTLEPCPMCLGALMQARIKRVVFGCYDHKRSDTSFFRTLKNQQSLHDNNHELKIEAQCLEQECSQILKEFFKKRREK